MKEILDHLERWRVEGKRVIVARLVAAIGSAPRETGAAMAISESDDIVGSVSGGCVEGALVSHALEVLAGRTAARGLVNFGYSDDEAYEVGLPCGGNVSVFVEPFDASWTHELFPTLRTAVGEGVAVGLATAIEGPAIGAKMVVGLDGRRSGSIGDAELDRRVTTDTLTAVSTGRSGTHHYLGPFETRGVTVFVQPILPPPRMVIFGAVDFAASLATAAGFLGFRVTVCDPRSAFATKDRFPDADEVVVDWPHRYLESIGNTLTPRDAICVLTHDEKIDVPAIATALATEAGYIGAMGSRRAQERRAQRLRAAGIGEQELSARVMSPIGIDIGARSPEEVAIAICAEVIALRTGHAARHLRDGEGPIHRRRVAGS